MGIFKEIGKWVRGWRLDKLFTRNASGEIYVQDAAKKASDFLVKVQGLLNSPEAGLLEGLLGDSLQELIGKAKVIIPEIIVKLEDVQVLPDVALKLQDYKFSDDPKKDQVYHDIVTSAALIFSDGKLSISDAAIALHLLSEF